MGKYADGAPKLCSLCRRPNSVFELVQRILESCRNIRLCIAQKNSCAAHKYNRVLVELSEKLCNSRFKSRANAQKSLLGLIEVIEDRLELVTHELEAPLDGRATSIKRLRERRMHLLLVQLHLRRSSLPRFIQCLGGCRRSGDRLVCDKRNQRNVLFMTDTDKDGDWKRCDFAHECFVVEW